MMSSAKEADRALLKLILEVIEGSNISRSEVYGLDSICFRSEYQRFFPTDKRAALRKKWDDLRRIKIQSYYKFLLDLGVHPGNGTLRELEEARNKEGHDDISGDKDDSIEENANEDFDLIQAFENLETPTRPPYSHPHPLATPPRGQRSSTPQLQSRTLTRQHSNPRSSLATLSPASSPAFYSPTMEYPGSVASAPLSSSMFSSIELNCIQGSKMNPFKFQVNRLFPEKNPARIGFCQITHYEYQGFEHKVWEAKVTIPHLDYDKWEAFFKFPCYIVFKAPSIGSWEKVDLSPSESSDEWLAGPLAPGLPRRRATW